MEPCSRFGLEFNPFLKNAKEIPVDTQESREAAFRLDYLAKNRGFGILTGAAGRGKTTAVRRWKASLNPSLYKVIYSSLSTLTVNDFYRSLASELGVQPSFRKPDNFRAIQEEICCSTYGRPRSKDFHWRHYKKLLEDNGLPDIRWHDLRSTFCTILLKNNFNPKAVSQLMGHAKEIITIDVYGDTAEIIEDCLDDLQPFIDEVIPKEECESGTDFSEDNYIEQISEFLA